MESQLKFEQAKEFAARFNCCIFLWAVDVVYGLEEEKEELTIGKLALRR